MPYGGNFLAVGGFSFFGGNDLGGRGKPKYGGIFSAVMQYGGLFLAVGGFSFFGGNDLGGRGKPKYIGIFSAVRQYGGNCLALMQYGGSFFVVSGCSFFGGNVSLNSNLAVIAVPTGWFRLNAQNCVPD